MSEIGQKIIASIRKHAAEDPHYQYEAYGRNEWGDPNDEQLVKVCRYVVDGHPSCIVGKALWDTDLIDASMEGLDANTAPFNRFNADELPIIQDLSRVEVEWIGNVQREQDGGTPWGTAVQTADELMEAFK